jgi:membrane protease YdiL (CAAX protease family)
MTASPSVVSSADPASVRRSQYAVLAYVVGILAVDVAVAADRVLLGSFLAAALILVIVNHQMLAAPDRTRVPDRSGRGDARLEAALAALALVPLLRLLAPMAALTNVSDLGRYVVIGTPVLFAAAAVVGWRTLRKAARFGLVDALVATIGAALSYPLYLLARPEPLVASGLFRGFGAAIALLVCSGAMEELVFRGAVQGGLTPVFPRLAVALSTVLFAGAYASVRPVSYAAAVSVFGLFAGLVVHRTRSLTGVALAHGLLNVGALLVWPLLLG